MQRRGVVLSDVLGALDARRGHKRRLVGRAEIACEREGVRRASLHRPTQPSESRSVEVWLMNVGAQLGAQSLDQVGSAGDHRAGSEAQPDDGHGEAVPGGQAAPRGAEEVHPATPSHPWRTGKHRLGVRVQRS